MCYNVSYYVLEGLAIYGNDQKPMVSRMCKKEFEKGRFWKPKRALTF